MTIKDDSDRSALLYFIAAFLAQSNKPDEAIQIAKVIEEDNTLRSQALSSIAQSLAQSNRLDESAKLFDEAIKIANAIEDYSDKAQALSSIAQSLAQSNKPDEAIQIANAIKDEYKRSEALSSIAQSLAQSNRLDESAKLFDEAIKIANAIEDDSKKSEALSKIIVEKLEVRENISKLLLEIIVTQIEDNLYETSISPLKTQELWSHIMKQCIGYPEMTYVVCSFVAEHYPKYSREIADLILNR